MLNVPRHGGGHLRDPSPHRFQEMGVTQPGPLTHGDPGHHGLCCRLRWGASGLCSPRKVTQCWSLLFGAEGRDLGVRGPL